MEELENKYIELLLNCCTNLNVSKSILINYDRVNKKFVDKLIDKAKEIGFNDIYRDEEEIFYLRDKLNNLNIEQIESDSYFNKNKWNEYAEKNSNFLMFREEFPGVLDDIPYSKIERSKEVIETTRHLFREKQRKYEIPWCTAALPTEIWARKIFPNSKNSYEDLFKIICKMCMVDTENPIESWNTYLEKTKVRINWLNSLEIEKLYYLNKYGTDLVINMPKNHVWHSVADNKNMFVNMPSYEIFSSPDYRYTEGTIHCSKPLNYDGQLIEDLHLVFDKGKVVEFHASKGFELLKQIIKTDPYTCYLGEVSFVNYNSPISNTGLVFGNTLLDENASCHLALGNGFCNCIKNGANMDRTQLLENGINQSFNHIDFMIGTEDLNIEAKTKNGKVLIFKNGNFTK